MRQIEILKYTCPLCNAQLSCQATDFSNDSVGSTKSMFKCIGCMEEFYSQEQAYVSPPEKTTEFLCSFCKKQCLNMHLKDDWTEYWKCIECKMSYEMCMHPDYQGVERTNMYTTLHGNLYVLRQFHFENRSRVEMLPEKLEDTVVIAREFPFLMPTVTPTNIQEKLLTYLVFS